MNPIRHPLRPSTDRTPRRPIGPPGDWQSLIGRKIEAVVTRDRTDVGPPQSVYLVFSDGTTFEIFSYGGTLGGTSKAYPGGLAELLSSPDPGDDLRVFAKTPP